MNQPFLVMQQENRIPKTSVPSLIRAAITYTSDYRRTMTHPQPILIQNMDGTTDIEQILPQEPDDATKEVNAAANEALRSYFNRENNFSDPVEEDHYFGSWLDEPGEGLANMSLPDGRIILVSIEHGDKGLVCSDRNASGGWGVKPCSELKGCFWMMIPDPPTTGQ